MTVCKFWEKGTCKFGDQCRFEHPPGLRGSQSAQKQDAFMRPPPQRQDAYMRPPPQQDQNRFGQPTRDNQNQNYNANKQRYPNQQQSRGFRDYRGNHRGGKDPTPYGVTREIIQEDLRERPNWIMSGYGPGKDPDTQLFGGYPLEHSPEEVRLLHYQAMAAGNPQTSAQVEAELAQISNEQVEAVSNDLSGALHYLANGSKEHPNRNDVCKAGTSNLKRNGDGPFSKSTRHREISEQRRARGSTGFGQTQTGVGFASQQPGFGTGAPNQQQTQTFGNQGFNTGFASQNQPAFGQQAQQNSFGTPQNAGLTVQPPPSGLGQPDQPMASPQMMQSNTAFGINNNNSAFGQPQQQQQLQRQQQLQPQMNNAFGQPQMQQQQTPFLNNPQQQQQQQQQQPQMSPFGASPLNQQQPQQPFGSGFGQQPPQAPMNGFQQQMQPQQPNGPGGNPSSNGDVNSYTTRDASNKLLTWKGRPVNYLTADEPCYQQNEGSWERIWFPDGEPKGAQTNANQAGGFSDIEQFSSGAKEAYVFLKDNGSFKDGTVPEIAPVAGMVRWDV